MCCEDQPQCLKCGPTGCMKCPKYIAIDSRTCVSECPRGYAPQWSTAADFMGQICRPTGFASPVLEATVGILVGCLLCAGIIATTLYIIRRKRRRKCLQEALIDDTIERAEFLKQLDELRPNAEYFLAMLNDTRRQIRKLHLAGDTTGATAYCQIVRDLAKILLLINKPADVLNGPPHDWSRLSSWAVRVLERYKPQIAQLIDFLQSPAADPRLAACQHHTFKSTTTTSTTASESPNLQMQHFGSLISLHDLDDAQAADPFGSNFSSLKRSSDIAGSTLWLEDEFFKLGLRPQDEITTEL
ncbi:uncharacterized protein LOC132257771 isoform X2 [Phlebotomus argentipes]|uniref:uncharacterized protein LOC132257771 isoform X2 n=1 Tax=Phlebotomus argentipes TaxID=94469 RepID=UPI0028932CA0|nr:uncharacterized protein LOC132257771 isoform X2 [Phlebotomus argentipes]